MESGYRFQWAEDPPPLSPCPVLFPPPSQAVRVEALDFEIRTLLKKGAVEEVSNHGSPGFYSRLFIVPKSKGGWRPVLDLSVLNRYLRRIKFKMETPMSIRGAIRQRDWACSIDLKDAYFHVPVHRAYRKFLRFSWGGKVFQFVCLPFGLAHSPYVFTRVVKELATILRRRGVRIHCYLDDWLILAQDNVSCKIHSTEVCTLTNSLGFVINQEKSSLSPTQSFEYLGMLFDTQAFTVQPTLARRQRLQDSVLRLRGAKAATARQLAAVLGQMESLAPLLPLGRLHKRPLQRHFRLQWSQSTEDWDQLISLGQWYVRATDHWLYPEFLSSTVPIVRPVPTVELYTDASLQGWGGHVDSLSVSGCWTHTEKLLHINRLELEATFRSLQAFEQFLKGKTVRLFTDNTTVACYVNKEGGARSTHLGLRTEDMLFWCQSRGISLSARHIPGKLNIVADALSRSQSVLHTEWTLHEATLQQVWNVWFRPMVDLFATQFNRRLPLYISPVPDPGAWAVDAMAISWGNLLGYAFPPLPILGRVIRKAREESATLILVAPNWPSQPWFPDLLQLTHTPPLPLPLRRDLLIQPRSRVPHNNPGQLQLHAWLLCGSRCSHQALLTGSST